MRPFQWKGGEILTHIYEQCSSGDPFLKQTFQRFGFVAKQLNTEE